MKLLIFLLAGALAIVSCQPTKDSSVSSSVAAAEFDFAHSDPAAVELADSIMIAMGGQANWDNTRYITWDFNGQRKWIWDKKLGRARIENYQDSVIYLIDLNSLSGRVQIKGRELTDPASAKEMLGLAKTMYFDDLNWLAMPFRLKDDGATLKYMGEDTLKGNRYNVLLLTFQDERDKPRGKYKIYVGVKEKLVKHWAYYKDVAGDVAEFTRPWDNYQKYGTILLSGNRSDGAGPKGVKVEETVSDKAFTEF